MRKEREINLKNMLWYVIRGWRAIIICMLILAILFGVRQYRTDYNNAVANQNVVTPSLLDIKNSLSEQEIREIGIMQQYQLIAQSTADYMNNSILMQIPYDKEQSVVLQYYVKDLAGNEIDNAANAQAYYNYACDGSLAADIVGEYDDTLEEQYIAELLTASVLNNSVKITIVHYDMTEAEKLASLAKKAMEKYAEVLNSTSQAHELVLQSETEGVIADYELFKLQSDKAGFYDSAAGTYLGWKEKMNANQQTVIDNWEDIQNMEEQGETENEVSTDRDVETEQTIHVSVSIKSVLLGAVAGLFLSILVLLAVYISTKKMRDVSDYRVLGVEVLGTAVEEGKKHKILSGIDKCLDKLQYSDERNFNEEERFQMLCSAIYLRCKNNGIDKVYLSGTLCDEKTDSKLFHRVMLALKEKGVDIQMGQDMVHHADSLIRAAEIKNVILVEREWNSVFSSMEDEVEICTQNEICVLGGIMVRA